MQGAQPSVLIVDGDAAQRASLGDELKRFGYQISLAPDGRIAFENFPAMAFDCIFADTVKSQGNGPEIIAKLQEKKLQIPVILTSSEPETNADLCKSLGASGFLKKPFEPNKAVETIRQLHSTALSFTYFLNIRRTLTVASWAGELHASHAPLLHRCLQEILTSNSKYVILNMQGFTGYDAVLAGDIVSFQEKIRKKPMWLVLSGLSPDVQTRLASKGLINESEIMKDLPSALQYLLSLGMG
ncbi:MAG TPA: response regulator [Bdellovibrionota bacterium]|jgi:CheY-like chemotaxis protein